TCVTTVATLVNNASCRCTEPLPSLDAVESAVRMRPGRMDFAGVLMSLLPMKSSTPEFSLFYRLRWVSFFKFALSVVWPFAVMLSPPWCARWSLRRAREPFRHSELGLYDTGCGVGIGICTGL